SRGYDPDRGPGANRGPEASVKVTCNACGAVHQIAPPPWVVSAGRPFRMVCPSCGKGQEVVPTGLAVLDEPFEVAAPEPEPEVDDVGAAAELRMPVPSARGDEDAAPALVLPTPSLRADPPARRGGTVAPSEARSGDVISLPDAAEAEAPTVVAPPAPD